MNKYGNHLGWNECSLLSVLNKLDDTGERVFC